MGSIGNDAMRLHDAEMISVSVDRTDATARLNFRREDSTSCEIELRGVKAFRCEDMAMQNVVNRVLQSAEGQISTTEINSWTNWATSLSDASSWLDGKRKQEWLADLSAKKINLIVFEPSAGATVAVVCERLTVSKG